MACLFTVLERHREGPVITVCIAGGGLICLSCRHIVAAVAERKRILACAIDVVDVGHICRSLLQYCCEGIGEAASCTGTQACSAASQVQPASARRQQYWICCEKSYRSGDLKLSSAQQAERSCLLAAREVLNPQATKHGHRQALAGCMQCLLCEAIALPPKKCPQWSCQDCSGWQVVRLLRSLALINRAQRGCC